LCGLWRKKQEESKAFFFEKKKQKTFDLLRAGVTPAVIASETSKFFCFFLFTKRRSSILFFLPFRPWLNRFYDPVAFDVCDKTLLVGSE